MPAVSQAQRAYLFAHFGKAWVQKHHFDNPGPLPARKGRDEPITRALAKRRPQ